MFTSEEWNHMKEEINENTNFFIIVTPCQSVSIRVLCNIFLQGYF